MDIEAWARSALKMLTGLPGVLRTGLALTEGGGRQLLFTASDRVTGLETEWCEVDAYDDVPLNNAVRTGKIIRGTLEELSVGYPEFVGRQGPEVRALASAPLSADGQTLGGFVLFYAAPQPFDDAQLDLLDDIGKRLGKRLGKNLRRGRRGTDLSRSLAAEPLPTGARAATHVVTGDPQAVALARQFARTTLAAWDIADDAVANAVLCISELVTNAIIHTHAGCEIRVALRDAILTVTVRDGGTTAAPPRSSGHNPLAVRGRGLEVVAALSARWGSELDGFGTTVWCELDAG